MNIRNDIKYSIGNVDFINYTMLTNEQSMQVLESRNNCEIRKWMFNKDRIDVNSHNLFIRNLSSKDTVFYWACYLKSNFLGCVYLNEIDYTNSTAVWGYFLNPSLIGSGKGLDLEFYAMILFFDKLKIESINGLVDETNENAISLHKIFGFKKEQSSIPGYRSISLTRKDFVKLPQDIREFKMHIFRNNN